MVVISKEAQKAHFTEGNTKIGKIYSWSKLAGNGEINGCKGTCGKYCQGCYDPENPKKSGCYCFKSYAMYPEVAPCHINNTNAMRQDMKGTFEKLNQQLSRSRNTRTVRIHAAGEIESAEELWGWNNLAMKHPERKFYVYTKNSEALDEVMERLKKNKKGLSKNFYILVSVWHEYGIDTYNKWKECRNIKCFAYCDDFDYKEAGLDIKCMCPAYRQNAKGKVILHHDMPCSKCQLCFNDKVKVIGCLNH